MEIIFDHDLMVNTLPRIFRRPTPPSTSLMNIDEGAEEDENLTGTKSVPGTIRKKKPLQGSSSLETGGWLVGSGCGRIQ